MCDYSFFLFKVSHVDGFFFRYLLEVFFMGIGLAFSVLVKYLRSGQLWDGLLVNSQPRLANCVYELAYKLLGFTSIYWRKMRSFCAEDADLFQVFLDLGVILL